MATGRFITLEGPEGSGKSTHVRLLKEKLEARGIEVLSTREPGGTKLSEAIRGMLQFDTAGETPTPRAELLLFLASRAQLVDRVIRPALEEGKWVLSDRFCDSTFAYQGYGRGMDVEVLKAINAFATGDLMPDRTLLLDVPLSEGTQRVAHRKGPSDRFEQEQDAFHLRLRDGFHALAKENPERIRVIDTTPPQEETADAIWQAIEDFLV